MVKFVGERAWSVCKVTWLILRKGYTCNMFSEVESSAYRRFIDCLLYLTNTTPNITFSVNNLIQFIIAPTKAHQQAVFRILRYLKPTPRFGIFFHNSNSIQLRSFSDSDWATYLTTRKSITGFSVYLGNSLISWKSMEQ